MGRPARIAACAAAVVALGVPAGVVAQSLLPPSLTVETGFAPPDGISRTDLAGNLTDIASAVAVDGERIYTVGQGNNGTGNTDLAVVAHRLNGSYDNGWSGDGKLLQPIAADTGKDIGWSIVVLPDHRIRVLVETDVTPGSGSNTDIGIIGFNPDGGLDTPFGGGDGVITFPIGANDDTPTRLVAGPDGRLAVAGTWKDPGGKENSFVSLREADGSPVAGFGTGGVVKLDRGGTTLNDRAVDVAFRPGGGLIALIQNETNPDPAVNDYQAVLHAFDDVTGANDARFSDDGDLVLAVGDPDTVPGAVLPYDGKLLVTGATKVGQDTDAFIARLNPDGSGLDFRRYDMRGGVITADKAVTSAGSDMAVVGDSPPTLAVTGSVNYGSRPYWAGAVFNKLDKPLSEWGFGDLIIPTEEYGAIVGVAAGGADWVAAGGSLVNTQQNFDTSFGTTRLLIDAEKSCDLKIDVPRPLEIGIAPGGSAPVTIEVSNAGSRPCAGSVSVDDPYVLTSSAGTAGAIAIETLNPGAKVTLEGTLSYGGPRKLEDTVSFTVTAPGDMVAANNTKRVHVLFDFCDLRISPPVVVGGILPTEGTRTFSYELRNVGTRECRRVRLAVVSGARVRGRPDPFTLRRGRGATETVRVAALARAEAGTDARIAIKTSAERVANDGDDTALRTVRIVNVGDSDIVRSRARAVSGRARAGGKGLAPAKQRLRRVDVAIYRRAGRRCAWRTPSGALRARGCDAPIWLRARGTSRWRLAMHRALGPGRYVLYSRATNAAGLREASFSRRDRNRVTFTIR